MGQHVLGKETRLRQTSGPEDVTCRPVLILRSVVGCIECRRQWQWSGNPVSEILNFHRFSSSNMVSVCDARISSIILPIEWTENSPVCSPFLNKDQHHRCLRLVHLDLRCSRQLVQHLQLTTASTSTTLLAFYR